MKALIIDFNNYREQSERDAQSARSEHLRRAENQAALREELHDAEWNHEQGLRPLPTLIAAIVGALIWIGAISLFWLV